MRDRVKIAILLSLLIAAVWWICARSGISFQELSAYGKTLSVPWFMAAFLVFPLLGFPVNVFLILAGARFGFWGGMGATAVSILFHNFVAYRLVKGWLHDRVKAALERRGYAVPSLAGKDERLNTALFVLIQGPPYVVKLYLLALTNIRLTTYLWVGSPIYILFAMVSVGIGSSALHFDSRWVTLLALAFVCLAIGGRWVRKRYGSPSRAGS